MSIISTRAQLSTIADMPLLRLFVIGLAMPLVFQLACSSTDDHINVHVTIWDGAVIIDSTTLAVVGWEYDHAQPADAWASSEYSNIYQYLYKYHLEDSSLELVATLSDNAAFYATNPGVLYSEPWVVYTTNDGAAAVGMYNLVTGEKRTVLDEGVYLDAVSPNGRYLAYNTTMPNTPYIYDTNGARVVATADGQTRFFYVGDSLDVFAWRHCGFSACSVYVGSFRLSDTLFDTLGALGYKVGSLSSDKKLYGAYMSTFTLGMGLISELRDGVVRLDTLPNVSWTWDDLHMSSGLYVYQINRAIWAGNYVRGIEPTRIISNDHQNLE